MLDLSIPGAKKLLADRTRERIDDATTVVGKHSWRIKPSSLGKECIAENWYAYRWAKRVNKPGRIGRIFDKGHETEPRLMEYLRKSGWVIWDRDPNKAPDDPYPQFGFKALGGHISAYLDGIGHHPELTAGINILIEAKSYNKRRFGVMVAKTMKAADPEYYVQVCLYMKEYNLPVALFICECKDDGDIHIEYVERDDDTAMRALEIATTIKTSRIRPARVAESPAYHKCKMCDFVGVCHLGEPVEKNCRSCLNCVPIDGGKFACQKWNATIPNQQAIMDACDYHEPIK